MKRGKSIIVETIINALSDLKKFYRFRSRNFRVIQQQQQHYKKKLQLSELNVILRRNDLSSRNLAEVNVWI